MKRRLLDRVSMLEKRSVFTPPAPRPVETVTVEEDIRAVLREKGFEQAPDESLMMTCARALRTTYADMKQLCAMGIGPTGIKRLLDFVLNRKPLCGE